MAPFVHDEVLFHVDFLQDNAFSWTSQPFLLHELTPVGSPFHHPKENTQPGENLKQLCTVQKVGEHAT